MLPCLDSGKDYVTLYTQKISLPLLLLAWHHLCGIFYDRHQNVARGALACEVSAGCKQTGPGQIIGPPNPCAAQALLQSSVEKVVLS